MQRHHLVPVISMRMMRVSLLARTALVVSAVRPAFGFSVGSRTIEQGTFLSRLQLPPMTSRASSSCRSMSTTSTETPPPLKHIGREEMQAVLDSVEDGNSNVMVIDVRNVEEIIYTGPLSPDVKTLPLPTIMQQKVFEMDDEEFEEVCKFPKPEPDTTLVFTCAAGVRSIHAASFAAMGGYTNLVNYMGGANEWFSP